MQDLYIKKSSVMGMSILMGNEGPNIPIGCWELDLSWNGKVRLDLGHI